jgi:hypothetical protein
MEYLGGGEIKWRNDHDLPTLTLKQTRRIIRDAVLGLEYCKWSQLIPSFASEFPDQCITTE